MKFKNKIKKNADWNERFENIKQQAIWDRMNLFPEFSWNVPSTEVRINNKRIFVSY